jgi:hypothetical protein
MKKTLLLIALCLSVFAKAQTITNANFEDWTTDTLGRLDPLGWNCSNLSTGNTSVLQDVGRSGTGFSVKMVVVPTTGLIPIGGSIDLNTTTYSGTQRPTALKGYWKCNNTNGDFITVHVYVYDSVGNFITDKSITTSLFNSTGWTQFTAPLTYSSGVSVGSYAMNISLFAHGSASGASYGNVDDLQWDFNTGIDEPQSNFSSTFLSNDGKNFNLNFTTSATANIRAYVLDMSGREVLQIADEKLSPGSNSLSFNAAELSAGIYTCVISDGNSRSSVKMRIE